ncbi:hypothetical protein ACFSRY_02515 [Pontibacter locisalis]|uniref:Uncharacterized protein n=1 Tax=Pontibacter locisalis TaxID=1719035 RepID=A0ABW5IGE8_9BACT
MKKVMYLLMAAGMLTFGACASTEEATEEVEETAEEVEEEVEEEIDE